MLKRLRDFRREALSWRVLRNHEAGLHRMLAALTSAAAGMALIVTSPAGGSYLSPSPPFQPLGNKRDPRSAVLSPSLDMDLDLVAEDERHVLSGMSGRFDGEDEMLMNLAIMGEDSAADFPLAEDYTFSNILPTDGIVKAEFDEFDHLPAF